MSNGLRTKDICNCDQALVYREALQDIRAELDRCAKQNLFVPDRIIEKIVNDALDHPEAE